MSDRKDEISATLHLITEICLNSEISLRAKEYSGQLIVIAKDERNGKEYAMCKSEGR
ncbi:MAG: hypothetical protein H6Q73_897 [Firmicutes bacterium]|nr:hypothetical protein [Bacillota bacterium]